MKLTKDDILRQGLRNLYEKVKKFGCFQKKRDKQEQSW